MSCDCFVSMGGAYEKALPPPSRSCIHSHRWMHCCSALPGVASRILAITTLSSTSLSLLRMSFCLPTTLLASCSVLIFWLSFRLVLLRLPGLHLSAWTFSKIGTEYLTSLGVSTFTSSSSRAFHLSSIVVLRQLQNSGFELDSRIIASYMLSLKSSWTPSKMALSWSTASSWPTVLFLSLQISLVFAQSVLLLKPRSQPFFGVWCPRPAIMDTLATMQSGIVRNCLGMDYALTAHFSRALDIWSLRLKSSMQSLEKKNSQECISTRVVQSRQCQKASQPYTRVRCPAHQNQQVQVRRQEEEARCSCGEPDSLL